MATGAAYFSTEVPGDAALGPRTGPRRSEGVTARRGAAGRRPGLRSQGGGGDERPAERAGGHHPKKIIVNILTNFLPVLFKNVFFLRQIIRILHKVGIIQYHFLCCFSLHITSNSPCH